MQKVLFFIIETIEHALREFAHLDVFASRDDSERALFTFSSKRHDCGTREWRGLGWQVMVSPLPVRSSV